MKTSAICPVCQKPVSIWQFMLAPTPFHIRCSACKANLRVKGWTVLMLILAILLGLILGCSMAFLYFSEILDWTAAFVAGILILLIIEILAAILIVNKGILVSCKKTANPPQDSTGKEERKP